MNVKKNIIALVAATLAIPSGFRMVIDKGFERGGNPADIADEVPKRPA